MPYKRPESPYWQIDLRPDGYDHRVGPYSTRTEKKSEAESMEGTIRQLARSGRHEPLDALRDGEIALPQLHAAYAGNRLNELMRKTEYPPLDGYARQWAEDHHYDKYELAVDNLLEVAPDGARTDWLLDPENVIDVLRWYRRNDYAPGTEHVRMAGVSQLITDCHGRAARDKVWERIKLRPVNNERTRWLSKQEINRIRQVADEDTWTLILTAITTGLRKSELLDLRVRDIEFDNGDERRGVVIVTDGKTSAAHRRVPITGEVVYILKQRIAGLQLSENDEVFPVPAPTAYWWWDRVRSKVNLEDVRWHDLRHTYAVHCARAGMPLPELKARMGHSSIRHTMRYAAYSPRDQSERYEQAVAEMGVG